MRVALCTTLVLGLLVVGCSGGDLPVDCNQGSCPDSQYCYDNACRSLCNGSDDCTDGQGCVNGLCTPCQDDAHCSGAYACNIDSGQCHTQCQLDLGCKVDAVCYEDGTCLRTGFVGDDCKNDDGCSSGNCLGRTCCPSECELGCVGAICTKPPGETCTDNALCATGFCANGVCCDAACEGPCQNCNALGACTPLPISEVDDCKIGPSGARMCNGEGACTGPHMLVDVNPTGGARQIVQLADGTILFFAHSPQYGDELWAATLNQPAHLVRDIYPGMPSCEADSMTLSTDKTRAYFVATDGVYGRTLWTTEGTAETTVMLHIGLGRVANSPPEHLTAIGPHLYFSGTLGEESARAWISDGTPQGTRLIEEGLATKSNAFVPNNFVRVGDRTYFQVHSNIQGVFMHQAGSPPIVEVPGCEGRYASSMVQYGGNVFFLDGSAGLYKINTTTVSCSLVAATSNAYELALLGGKLVYHQGHNPRQVTVSDGSPGGTTVLFSTFSSEPALVAIGSTLYSVEYGGAMPNVYRGNDETRTGLLPEGFTPHGAAKPLATGSSIFLTVQHAGSGIEPARLDLSVTPAVFTSLDLAAGTASSAPEFLGMVNGDLYFLATVDGQGRELVRWSGVNGAVEVLDLFPGSQGSYLGQSTFTPDALIASWLHPSGEHHLLHLSAAQGIQTDMGVIGRGNGSGMAPEPYNSLAVGQTASGQLFFCADDGIHGIELWTSDGTQQGTHMVVDGSPGNERGCFDSTIEPVGEQVLFAGPSGMLWVSDGTPAGTQELGDVPIYTDGFSYSAMHRWGGRVFIESDGNIFVSDATPANTVPLKPNSATWYDARVLGMTDDRVLITTRSELWRTDGTPEGTQLVKGFDVLNKRACRAFATRGNKFYFTTQNNAQPYNPTVWESDGTPGGTIEISDPLVQAICYSEALYVRNNLLLVHVDGGLYSIDLDDSYAWSALIDFSGSYNFLPVAQSGDTVYGAVWSDLGSELWRTNGTLSGTKLVHDFEAGAASGFAGDPTATFAQRYFVGAGSNNIFSLWSTQGESSNTFRACDATYPCQNIQFLQQIGQHLFIVADFGSGIELGVFP